MNFLPISIIVFVFLLTSTPAAAESFSSPQKRYSVSLQKISSYKSHVPPQNADDMSYIRYRIEFKDKAGASVASVEWNDVYEGKGSGAPMTQSEIFKSILWSPKEDFAILARDENFASAPGSENGRGVRLNPLLKWKFADVPMDHQVWLDDLRLVADDFQDCSDRVLLFDGKTGEVKDLRPSGVPLNSSPVGFGIAQAIPGKLIIGERLDNCAESYPENRLSKCWLLDEKKVELNVTPCPAPPKAKS